MLEKHYSKVDFNDMVNEINKNRNLGSSNQCYNVMYKTAYYFNVKKMLEIGTHRAASTITYCQAILDKGNVPEIHTVDNWSQVDLENLAKSHIEKAGFENYITMHNGDSLTKVPEVFKQIGKVDLVFIDGNHNPVYVLQDFMNCKDCSNLILFHDTGYGYSSYFKEVRENGYKIYNFETKYLEGDGHLVGIALAIKK